MIEYILKTPLGLIRLRSGKWIHDITRIDDIAKKAAGGLPPSAFPFSYVG